MRFEQYDYISGNVIGPMTSLDFGDVVQGQHCIRPVVMRIFSEPLDVGATNLAIYLTGKGSWENATFGYFMRDSFVPLIEAGSSNLSQHFRLEPNAVDGSPNGVPVPFNGSSSSWVWLDVQCPADQISLGTPSFRVTYETD